MTKFYDEVGISVENLYKALGENLTNRNYIQVTCEDENRLFYDLYNENGQLVFCDGEVAKVVALNDDFVVLMNQEEESEITLSINEFENALFLQKGMICND